MPAADPRPERSALVSGERPRADDPGSGEAVREDRSYEPSSRGLAGVEQHQVRVGLEIGRPEVGADQALGAEPADRVGGSPAIDPGREPDRAGQRRRRRREIRVAELDRDHGADPSVVRDPNRDIGLPRPGAEIPGPVPDRVRGRQVRGDTSRPARSYIRRTVASRRRKVAACGAFCADFIQVRQGLDPGVEGVVGEQHVQVDPPPPADDQFDQRGDPREQRQRVRGGSVRSLRVTP